MLRLHASLAVIRVLVRRDLLRFVRQPARIGAAIGTPLVLWFFLASGVGRSFQPEALDISYGAFLFPAVLTLVAVFSAIFAAISIIEDRNEGWLQAVLAGPAPFGAVALGRILGGAIVAWLQAAILLPIAWFTDLAPSVLDLLLTAAILFVTCVGTSALGVYFAWKSPTSAAFHAVMNLVFMPMWLLSGAFFPADAAHAWLAWCMRLNPLAWATDALRTALQDHAFDGWSIGGVIGATAVMLLIAQSKRLTAGR